MKLNENFTSSFWGAFGSVAGLCLGAIVSGKLLTLIKPKTKETEEAAETTEE